jgi:DNA-binding response OmpR family regulator
MSGTERKTVLICDDEPHIRESIRYAVEKQGFAYLLANDGNAAYDKACTEQPDLVILDVGMPGMTGYEVCEKLRSQPLCADMKILILTAFGQAADEQKAYEVGATQFIAKPFSPRALRQKLAELLA